MPSLQTDLKTIAVEPAAVAGDSRLLSVVDLRKSFESPGGKRIDVLRGVTFEVRAGETVAIVGASGSGKSTLLHLLGGLEESDHGSISLADTDLGRLKGNAMAVFRQRSIGFVFQFHYLLADLSATENVALPLLISRLHAAGARDRAIALLTQMGLETRVAHPTSQLSGGEQQRVALARALVTAPKLLLADEPTGNLDADIGEEIGKSLVNYVRKEKAAAIVATHSEMLASRCDRVLKLEGGRIYTV